MFWNVCFLMESGIKKIIRNLLSTSLKKIITIILAY